MTHGNLVIIGWILGIAVLAGCVREGPKKPVSKPGEATEERATVVLLDADLKGKIAVEKERADWSSGKLKIDLNVRNRTDYEQKIEIQTIFKDADWISVGDETSWTMMILDPRETKTYTITSVSDKTKNYTVRIRWAR
jgi:uncharacterized protein YcfL